MTKYLPQKSLIHYYYKNFSITKASVQLPHKALGPF